LPILARKLRWQFEKMIILRTRAAGVQDFQEPAFRLQIVTVAPCVTRRAACCGLLLRVAPFHFLSRVEKHERVAATNMNSHFIDGFAGSLDIRCADMFLSKVMRMRMAQTPAMRASAWRGVASLRRPAPVADPSVVPIQIKSSDGSAGRAGE
jgi:hypothetical protein